MKGRARLEQVVNGGTAAPPGGGGRRRQRLGQAVSKARGGGSAMERAKRGMVPLPGGLPGGGSNGPLPDHRKEMQAPRNGGTAAPPGRRAAVAAAAQPGLGHQLTRRVQSGAISQDQAQQTSQQRQTLQAAFGKDWREQTYQTSPEVAGANLQELRVAVAGDHKGDPVYEKALADMLAARSSKLEKARRIVKSGRKPAMPALGDSRAA